MTRNRQSALSTGIVVLSLVLAPGWARAVQVTWTVDSSVSYLELTIPDQTVNVTNIGNVTVSLLDDPETATQWTDAGGRRAALAGTILTHYADGVSISFPGNGTNLYALQQTSLRPSPADWKPATTNYVGTNTAPAAFGARVQATYSIPFIGSETFDVAYMAITNVQFNITSGVVPVVAGALATNQTQFGISAASLDMEGLSLPYDLGQPVPDVLGAALPPTIQTNNAGGTIQNLGGSSRKLTYPISMAVSITTEGITLTGSAAGQIVASGTIPSSPTLQVAPTGNQAVLLAWPTNATGFVLQQNMALGSTNWATVTNAPVVVGSEEQVTLPASAAGSFYRLLNQ
jgi:hypothetical protein